MDRQASAALPTTALTAPTARTFDAACGADHRRTIEESHARCRALGLSERSIPELDPFTAHGARVAREQHQRLFEHATPVMEMLLEQILATRSIVALTDTEGNVLQAVGDPAFLDRVEQVALAPGVNWSEPVKGTNAVGTALFTEAPTLVHGQEHFLMAHRFLTCSASPIFDHAGRMMGVLDVSGHHSAYHPHTLAMVTLSARMIENQWFADRFRRGLRLHFHARAQMLGTVREAMVALAPDGAILGANRNALEQLGLNVPALRKLGLEAVFGVRVPEIVDHCRRPADLPMALVLQHGEFAGQVVHARAVVDWPSLWQGVSLATGVATGVAPAPVNAPALPAPAAPTVAPTAATLQAQEMAAIQAALQATGGNISRAARQLGVARNTIYRKLRGSPACHPGEGRDPSPQ